MKSLLTLKNSKIKNIKRGNSKYFAVSPYINIEIPIYTNLPLPKSGTYFIEAFKKINFVNKNVLDIGTGYLGYLGQHAKYFGASNVLLVDIDKKAIKSAKNFNLYGKKNKYRVSDVYSNIPKNNKIDIIISNPPQLPSNNNNNVHDFGGPRGLDIIKKIIDGFNSHSNKNGILYILIFDFLLKDVGKLCNNNNLLYSIVGSYNKKVRKGGETEQKIKFIEKIFLTYKFKKVGGNYFHEVYILKIKNKK